MAKMIEKKIDERGWLAELIKDKKFGQIFVVVAKPDAIRGNHYHKRKRESFFIIKGEAEIILENINTKEKKKLTPTSEKIEEIKIPPFWSHAIRNTGKGELYILSYVDEIYDEKDPDTFFYEVVN